MIATRPLYSGIQLFSPIQRCSGLCPWLQGIEIRLAVSPLVTQLAQQAHKHPVNDLGGLFVIENFYTRHLLVQPTSPLERWGVSCFLGTWHLNIIDALNLPKLKATNEELKQATHGEWRLCQAYNIPKSVERNQIVATNTWYVVLESIPFSRGVYHKLTCRHSTSTLPKSLSVCFHVRLWGRYCALFHW